MHNPDKSLKDKEAFREAREALSQALGLNLADETAEKLLKGEDSSLEQLTKHHTLTEIGTALIRLDAIGVTRTEEPCECFRIILGVKWCYSCTQKPPDED